MKIYCAGKFQDSERVIHIANILKTNGHFITAEWWIAENQLNPIEVPFYDFNGVKAADILIVLLDKNLPYFGTLMEIGFALALGKPVYIIGTDPFSVTPLFNHPLIFPIEYFKDTESTTEIIKYLNYKVA